MTRYIDCSRVFKELSPVVQKRTTAISSIQPSFRCIADWIKCPKLHIVFGTFNVLGK